MAGALTPRDPLSIADDPAVEAAGGLTPTKFNHGVKLTGGSNKYLLERDTTNAVEGFNLTDRPSAATVIFPLTAPSSPANGSFWVEDDGTTVWLKVKRANGDVVQIEF